MILSNSHNVNLPLSFVLLYRVVFHLSLTQLFFGLAGIMGCMSSVAVYRDTMITNHDQVQVKDYKFTSLLHGKRACIINEKEGLYFQIKNFYNAINHRALLGLRPSMSFIVLGHATSYSSPD